MSLADTASAILAKNGEPVTIQFPGTPGYDPVTGEPSTPTAGQTVVANGYPSRYKSSEIDGTTVLASDTRLILELINPRPQANCVATVNGKTFRVMDVQPIRKAGDDVLYIAQLRAG